MAKIGMFWGSNNGNQEEAAGFLKDYLVEEGCEIDEFNIGHFLVGESIFNGLGNTIKKFKNLMK